MFFEEEDQINDDYSISEVLEYLVQKLESRYNSIIKFKELLDNLGSPETFFTLKKDFKLLFNDLELDFKQGIFAIKALKAQNKKLMDDLKDKIKENKELADQLNNAISENKNVKLQIIKFKDKNSQEIKKEKESSKKNINRNEDFDKNENNFEYKLGNINTLNENNNINDEKNQNKEFKKNNFELEQLSNVRNIMDNMKKNKMKLKLAIEQHFNNNNIDNEY